MRPGVAVSATLRLGDQVDGPAILTEPAVMPHESGDRPLDRGNLRRALELMEAAGYTPGDDGLLRNEAGETLDIEFLETRQSFDRIITALSALGRGDWPY